MHQHDNQNTSLVSPGSTSIKDSELAMTLGGTKPGKEDLSPPCREDAGNGWLSVEPLKSVCPTILTEWLEDSWVAWGPLLKTVKGPASQCTPGIGHRPSPEGTYACWLYTPKVCNGANHNGWAPIDEHTSHIGTWKQKAGTVTDTNLRKLEVGSPLKKKFYLRTKGIFGISLRRHLGLGLLLQHNGRANNTYYCVSQDQFGSQNHIMLTWSCC